MKIISTNKSFYKKYELNIFLLGIAALITCTLLNTSKWGASLSWVLAPCIFIIVGFFFVGQTRIYTNTIWILVLWGVFFVSTIFSDIVEIQRDLATFFVFCVIYILAVSYKYSTIQIRFLVNIFIVLGMYGAINIVYNWITHNYYNEWFRRSSFTFLNVYKDPNYAMAFILPAQSLLFFKFIYSNNMKKILYLVGILCGIVSMLATGSRSAMLTFVLFIIIYLTIPSKMRGHKKMFIICSAVLVLLCGYNLMLRYLPAQAVERLFSTSNDPRLGLWESALTVFKSHPIFGGGMEAATTVSRVVAGQDSHNVYIDILCNSGIIGSLFFLTFFISNCLQSSQSNKIFIYSITIAFMLPMFFINGFNTATFYTPLIFLSVFSHYCRFNKNKYQDLFN